MQRIEQQNRNNDYCANFAQKKLRLFNLLISVMKFILFLLLLGGLGAHTHAQSDRFYLAHYNLENLFDTIDQAQTDDVDFTPGGKLNWTSERLNLKNQKLAQVIGDMNTGRGPDVLGLCEVENRQALEQLLGQIQRSKRRYSIVHEESPDPRGIDVALLYDSKKLNTCIVS